MRNAQQCSCFDRIPTPKTVSWFHIQLILQYSQCNIAISSVVKHFLVLPHAYLTRDLCPFLYCDNRIAKVGKRQCNVLSHHPNKRHAKRGALPPHFQEGSMLTPRALNGGKVHSSKRLFNAILYSEWERRRARTTSPTQPTTHKTQTTGKILDVITPR